MNAINTVTILGPGARQARAPLLACVVRVCGLCGLSAACCIGIVGDTATQKCSSPKHPSSRVPRSNLVAARRRSEMLASQTLAWQQEEEEELRRRGRFTGRSILDAPSSQRSRYTGEKQAQAPSTPVRDTARASLTPTTEISSSRQGKQRKHVQNLWPEPESLRKAVGRLLFDEPESPRTEEQKPAELNEDKRMGSSESSWSPVSTMCNFDFAEGDEQTADPLAEAGLELMKASLRDIATQTFVVRTKRFGSTYNLERNLKPMPCAQHAHAVKKAGSPQPSFRTTTQRLAPAWEQSASKVPSNMVFRAGKIPNTVSYYQGNNRAVGPGTYDNMHKDRFGAMQVGDRSKTLWDLHLFDTYD